MNLTRALALVALCCVSIGARAETVYVADRLELGLHESPQVTSPILVLLPTGSALEVLERAGDMTRVRTDDGVSGWIDERFVTAREPERARVEVLETELAGAQAALADAQAKLVAAEAAANERGRTESSVSEAVPSDALREMQRLAEENQRMKQQLAELEAMQRMALEQAATPHAAASAAPANPTATRPTPPPDSPPWHHWQSWTSWNLLLTASVLLLAFSAGGWLVDWGVRRRHGGYRI